MSTIDQATFEKLRNEVGADFMDELITAYCDETPQLIASLQHALAAHDVGAFRQAAHSIKSTSNTLGALSLGERAKDLEVLGRSGDLAGAAQKVERLVVEYEQVQQALKDLKHD